MKRIILGILSAAFALAVAISNPIPATADVSASLDSAVYSAYVWRGQVLNDELVLQPSMTVTTEHGISINGWGSYDLTERNQMEGDFAEIDLTISYATQIESIGVEVGAIEYMFPNTNTESTRELYASFSANEFLLSPSITAYWDIDEVNGFYFKGSINQGMDLIEETLDVNVSFSLGLASSEYNQFYFGVKGTELNDANVGIAVSYSVNEDISLGGEFNYTVLLDDQIDNAVDDGEQLWGGVTASVAL